MKSAWRIAWEKVARDRRRARRRKIIFWAAQCIGAAVLAAALAMIAIGCTPGGPGSGFTDEQWRAFCPDGHCPIYKIGMGLNEAEEARMPE